MRKGVIGPTKTELCEATLKVLADENKEYITKDINDQVAILLQLSEEYLKTEDESGVGTAYDYRMRWVRTELKKQGKIYNPKRGIWKKA